MRRCVLGFVIAFALFVTLFPFPVSVSVSVGHILLHCLSAVVLAFPLIVGHNSVNVNIHKPDKQERKKAAAPFSLFTFGK